MIFFAFFIVIMKKSVNLVYINQQNRVMFNSLNNASDQFYKGLRGKKTPLASFEFFGYYSSAKKFDNIQKEWTDKVDYEKVTNSDQLNIVIVDTTFKIIFASEKITKMNGYYNSEIIGKSPKMFQGKDTDERVNKKIRTAIDNQVPFKEVILNYKKDGTTYYCEIEAYPRFNKKGELLNYIAFERAAA